MHNICVLRNIIIWFFDSMFPLLAKNLSEASQVEAYNTVYKLDFFFIPEPFLGYSIQEKYKNIHLDGYNLLWSDHPSNSKRGGVCIFTEKL